MKKRFVLVALSVFSLLSACGLNKAVITNQADENLVKYSRASTDDYEYITLSDKSFVPFCAVDNTDRGQLIGIVGEDSKDKIFSYKDYPVDEWIIEFYESGEMDSSMLLREESVTVFPEGLESEYEWNQFVTEESCVSEQPTESNDGINLCQAVMVNGITYENTGYKSSAVGCGNMDGEIVSTVGESEMPNENDQSNFGTGYSYQYGTDDRLIVLIDGDFCIFRDINSNDKSIPPEVLHFIAKVKEKRDNELVVSVVEVPDMFVLSEGDYVVSAERLEGEVTEGDYVMVWCDNYIEEVMPAIIPSVYWIYSIEGDEDTISVIDLDKTKDLFDN